MQVTILTCTPNIESNIFKRHAKALKKHTKNYEWLIIDNNRTSNFNHAREINRGIKLTSNKYLITLDDDLIVSEGWIGALLEAAVNNQVVGGVHRDDKGLINHSGGYILQNGVAGHFLGEIDKLAYAEYVCSAVMLIDVEFLKNTSLYFDESYSKFFQEADFCFRIWESGGKVAITNKCDVTHLVGQVVNRLADRKQLFNIDSQYFNKKWINNGRLEKLLHNIQFYFDNTYINQLKKLDLLYKEYDSSLKNSSLSNQRKIIKKFESFQMYDSAVWLINEFMKK